MENLIAFFPTPMLSQNFTLAISAHNLRQHISQTCRCCIYHIRDLLRIRRCMLSPRILQLLCAHFVGKGLLVSLTRYHFLNHCIGFLLSVTWGIEWSSIHIRCPSPSPFFSGQDILFNGTEYYPSIPGTGFSINICIMAREEAVCQQCAVDSGLTT